MAQQDYFLKVDGIEGESSDAKLAKTIEIDSWSWGQSQLGTHHGGSGGGAGKVTVHDIHFASKVNKASPKIKLACSSGTHVKKAELFCRKAGGKEQGVFLKITMTDVLVSSYQLGGSPNSIVPEEHFSFNFGAIEMEYKEQKPDGTLGAPVKAGWDVRANKAM
jgi:type VI secretion system secreted protein Hcp